MEDFQVEAEIRARLAEAIGQDRFELWFGRQTRFRVTEGVVKVVAASSFTRDWLRRNFSDEVGSCCRDAMGKAVVVEFEVDESISATVAEAGNSKPAMPIKTFQPHQSARPTAAFSPRPQPHVTMNGTATHTIRKPAQRPEPKLSELVVGSSNEYAVRAAEVTAHGLQQASPVTFCGVTGVGKTHLLRAIRAEYKASHPRARAVYLPAELFITGFVEALRGSGLPSFRQKCRAADLLLVDDIQFFVNKRASLDELLHTLDALIAEGRQVVLASDRSLAELQSLGKELVSRLASGLVCNLQLPDFAMRLEIVRRLAREMAIELEAGVAELVATQISRGARELRGALHRLQATSVAYDRLISRDLAESALSDLVQQCTRHVRLADVEQAICNVFGVEALELRSERKSRSIQEPRMLAMWLARKYTRAPWSEIGEFFGRRSHSTVISAHRRVEKLISSHAEIGVSHETCGVEEAIRRVETVLRTA
jgi:chromosomal replication initiator protein